MVTEQGRCPVLWSFSWNQMANVPLKIPACSSSLPQLQQHKDNVVMSAALQNLFIWKKKSPVRLISELAVLQKCSSQMLRCRHDSD